ncbi:hypothetical protein ETAA8_10760 [Anatilimnocola aggregata]|uniref:Uncharacterized protein n=2 Tax=Anatilimnocola aggregata TaxID=2528021 RepID=A0A517Y6Z0_9BACT|nr:hypothetical protein ETAA8_10760 [Anatilimnocola aggregata]
MPIFAAVLLMLPVLYVISYLALVRAVRQGDNTYSFQCPAPLRPLYAPLFLIDIQLRPEAWWVREATSPPPTNGT